jgi:methyl-accepting chemotaxis protein
MAEQRTRDQEPVRTAQEVAARRSQSAAATASFQPAREPAKDAMRMAGQLAGLGNETMTIWTDATQHALRDVLELSAQATQEGARQLIQWQQTNLELLREVQRAAFRWYTVWPEFFRDPIRGSHHSLEKSMEATHRLFETTRRHAEAVAQSYERLERAADTATRTLSDTFREASTRMQDVCERSDRLRAA